MSYKVLIDKTVEQQIVKHHKSGNKNASKKIDQILLQLQETPREGICHPERLKNFEQEVWSRRIDKKHRLVYEIWEDELVVVTISAFGHYDDK